MINPQADITGRVLRSLSGKAEQLLLLDHTTRRPIRWATESYAHLVEGFQFADPVTLSHLVEGAPPIIQPRALKSMAQQQDRTRGMAEVFTPAWVCNAQNNLVDEAWFGRPDVFNAAREGGRPWQAVPAPIAFPEGKTWQEYVRSIRLEITCGEAPYLASRYDTTTGELIPLAERIGMLDRKLRIVSENTHESDAWLAWAQAAYKSLYAYEWQGDNLLLARVALLVSFVEYYEAKFGHSPRMASIARILHIISWNVWQMDGLKGVVPHSCIDRPVGNALAMAGAPTILKPCPGCASGNVREHTGTYCLIREWARRGSRTGESKRIVRFIDLLTSP